MPNNNITSNILTPTTLLHQLYPDIEEELCSRHSTLFGKLKQTFNKLYDSIFMFISKDMEPSSYVVVKGSCEFVEEQLTEIGLSMALENGAIGLLSRTYGMSEIFVNCNHFSEEVIFSHMGNIVEGLHPWVEEMQQIINLATKNRPESELYGGILYIHMNIPEYEFNYKQSFLVALYLSVMTINENLENKTLDQMVEEISSLGFVGKKCEIEKMFKGYKNGEFCLIVPDMVTLREEGSLLEEVDVLEEMNVMEGMVDEQEEERLEKEFKKSCTLNRHALHHENDENNYDHKSQHNHPHHILHHRPTTHLSIPITKNYKLLFCKLDLANDDIQYELYRREEIMSRKNQLLQELKEKYGINGLFELFHKVDTEVKLEEIMFESVHERVYQPKSMEELECMDKGDDLLNQPNTYKIYLHNFRLIQKLLQQTKFVSDFTNDKLTLEELINEIWQINSRDLKLHSEEVVELVEDMKEELGIGVILFLYEEGCMIVNRNFLMIVVNKNRFSELLCEVKHKMNRGELKSKSLFRIDDEDLVQQRWASDKVIGEKIFSSVPASGVGIFDPSEAIWFD